MANFLEISATVWLENSSNRQLENSGAYNNNRKSGISSTLIGKLWKTHPEIFLKFSFSGSSHRPFYWKTHPLKIMSTYSVFFNSGASHRPFYWKTHPLKIMRTYSVFAILGRPTDRFAGKFIHPNNLIKIPEPVNIVIAAILIHALTALKYCVETVLHHNLAFSFFFNFKFYHLLVFLLEIEVFLS